MILCLLTETLPKLKRWKVQYKFGVFLDSTVRMILRDSSCARVQFEEDREAYEIIEEESLQLEMKLAIKWWMSVYLNQKMATFGMTMIYYFLTFQPTNLNDILIYDKLYSAQSTSISCLHLKPTLLLSYHLFCCYSERWRTMLHVLSQNLTLTSSKMTSVMPELTESRAGCLHSIWNIHSFIEFPWV